MEDVTGNCQQDTPPDALTAAGHSAPVTASGALSPHCHRRRKRRRLLTGVSRQRRAANARERVRIQGVNSAFVVLKNTLPVVRPEEVSKIETLRLASKWIAYLTTVLIRDDQQHPTTSGTERGGVPESARGRLLELLHFEIEDFDLVETRSLVASDERDAATCDHGNATRDLDSATCDHGNATCSRGNATFDLVNATCNHGNARATNVAGDITALNVRSENFVVAKTTDVQYAMCNVLANNDNIMASRTTTHERRAKHSTYNAESGMDGRNAVTLNVRYPTCGNDAGFTTAVAPGARGAFGRDESAVYTSLATGYVDQTRFCSFTTLCRQGKHV